MKKQKRSSNRIKIAACLILITLAAFAGWKIYGDMSGSSKAGRVMKTLYEIVPGLGTDNGSQRGAGRETLSAVSIEGLDIVGVIEIPALDIMVPVTGKGCDEEFFVSWLDGSPVKGQLRLAGGRNDIFRNLAKLQPGDNVSFTDIEGVRYDYRVMTQFHIKKWDEADNALQLCYETDSDTYFVVGCTAAESL